MQQQDLEHLFRRQPCPRVRLHLSNGQLFEITDPDLIVLNFSTVEILLPPGETAEREAIIDLAHIVWIEVLPPAA